jgi:hypothetical protein
VTGADDTSAGSLVQPDYRGLLVGMDAFQRPLNLRNVVTPGTTGSDTVEYVRITSTTNSAAPVPEATETGGTSGTKPESGFTTVKIVTPVRTLAHWVPATKRALSDASQVRSLIDGFLLYGLEEELEDQMISGDGTGENLEGLANVSGVQVQPFDGQGNALALLRTLRKAKTKVRTIGRSVPNAYVLNPEDVERIDLTVDGMNRFYWGGPVQAGGTPPLWGLAEKSCSDSTQPMPAALTPNRWPPSPTCPPLPTTTQPRRRSGSRLTRPAHHPARHRTRHLGMADDELPTLVTPEEFRLLTGSDVEDDRAGELLAQASGLVRTWCGWHLAARLTQAVVVDGSGAETVALPTLHLVDLLAVTENGVPVELELVEWSTAGFLIRRSRRWTSRLRGVRAEILHGLARTPTEVRAVVIAIVARAVAHPAGTGVASERTGPFQITWSQTAQDGGLVLLDFEERVLDRYTIPDKP